MKDFFTLWNSIVGTTYDVVSTNPNRKPSVKYVEPLQVKRRCSAYSSAIIIAVIGAVGVLTGIFIHVLQPYDLIFRYKLIFEKGGEIYELWRAPPVDLYLKVHLWNVTNKEAYMNGTDKKLHLAEVGPYVYRKYFYAQESCTLPLFWVSLQVRDIDVSSRIHIYGDVILDDIDDIDDSVFDLNREFMSHQNVTFNENGTLSAIPSHPLEWVPELSEGRSEDDLLVLPNIALLSIADVVSDRSYFTRIGLNVVIRQTESEPLVQMTAREFMFGYPSTLMTLGNNFMPNWITFDKLGLIDRMYDFDGDYETVYSGQKLGVENIGLIQTYRGATKLPQWDSPCGDISGSSDGTKFQGFIRPNDSLSFFRKSMCRAKKLLYVNETILNDLKAYLYNFDPEDDDNGRVHKENKCFCKDPANCKPKGLLDVRGCYYGFPIALGYPHFLDGNESLSANVTGMNPDPAKHKSLFYVQPESGLPLQVHARFQINMHLGDIEKIAHCEKFSNMVLPLLWTENYMEKLPDNLEARFRLYLNVFPTAEKSIMIVSFVGGLLILFFALHKLLKVTRSGSQGQGQDHWIEDELMYNIDRKLSSYIPEKVSNLTAKELEVYRNSMVPLNADINRDSHDEHDESRHDSHDEDDDHEHYSLVKK